MLQILENHGAISAKHIIFPGTLQEDLSRLRRKLEKQKKVEVYSDADEILQEEINQYKVRTETHNFVVNLKRWRRKISFGNIY